MPAHLQEAPIILPLAAHEDRIHRGLHIVVDPALAGAAQERERLVMGVEHHLLALAWIGPDIEHPAVAEPQMRHLHCRRHPGQQDDLVAPVELVRFARGKAQRHIRCRCRHRLRAAPGLRVAPNSIIAAAIAQPLQFLIDPHQRQPLAPRLARVRRQQAIEVRCPGPQLGQRLLGPLIGKRRLARSQHFAHRVARHAKAAHDLLDRLALDEKLAPDPRHRLHDQHPLHQLPRKARETEPSQFRGPILDADHPSTGVNIPCRFTPRGTRHVETGL